MSPKSGNPAMMRGRATGLALERARSGTMAGMTDLRIALGTIPLGTTVDERGSFAILDRFVDAGGTLLDTADNYPFWKDGCTGDESETTIGRWLAARGNRDEVVLTTKVGARPRTPATGRSTTSRACRPRRSAPPSRAASSGWAPTTSTCTGRTSRTAPSRWRRPSPRSASSSRAARSGRSARATTDLASGARPPDRSDRGSRRTPTCSCATPTCSPGRASRCPRAVTCSRGRDARLPARRARPDAVGVQHADVRRLHAPGQALAGDRRPPGHDGPPRGAARGRGERGVSANQVVLAWLVAHGVVPIVGATRVEQVEEAVAGARLSLDADVVARLDAPA